MVVLLPPIAMRCWFGANRLYLSTAMIRCHVGVFLICLMARLFLLFAVLLTFACCQPIFSGRFALPIEFPLPHRCDAVVH